MTFPPVGYGFKAKGFQPGLLPWNETRRLDERALCFDPNPEYRAELKARMEAEARQEEADAAA